MHFGLKHWGKLTLGTKVEESRVDLKVGLQHHSGFQVPQHPSGLEPTERQLAATPTTEPSSCLDRRRRNRRNSVSVSDDANLCHAFDATRLIF